MNPSQPNHEKHEALTSALERKPEITVPNDFYLRLQASLPVETSPRRSRARISFARATAYTAAVCMAIALGILTLLHPEAIKAPESMTFILELMILIQLLAVGFWLGTRRED